MGRRDRFKGLEWASRKVDIIVGGVGGIGSWLTLMLARTNSHNIIVYDNDFLEEHNYSGQLFRTQDLGKAKVVAMQQIVKEFTDVDINYVHGKYTEQEGGFAPFMFSCFDNMKARREMFNVWKSLGGELFVDGRLLVESYQIYAVTKDRIDEYEKTLFDDSEVEEVDCTSKQTSHIAGLIAGTMTTIFTNYLAGRDYGVPFSTEFNGNCLYYGSKEMETTGLSL